MRLPAPVPASDARWQEPPEPLLQPGLYRGLLLRRVLAYGVDLVIQFLLAGLAWLALGVSGLLTLGLALPVLVPVVVVLVTVLPALYQTLLVGGTHSATWGMRLFGLRVYRFLDGGRPDGLQALVHWVLFYLTVPATSGLILLWCLFNRRQRGLHDVLSGVLILDKGVSPHGAPIL